MSLQITDVILFQPGTPFITISYVERVGDLHPRRSPLLQLTADSVYRLAGTSLWWFFLSMSVFSPVKFDISASTQPLIKLARVLLDVADVDELQFQFINAEPVKA
jgi:hypothetical protein